MPGGDGKPGEAEEAEEAVEADELGLSLEKVEESEDPGRAGGAAQNSGGVGVRCMPGGDEKPGEADEAVEAEEAATENDDCEARTRQETIAELRNNINERAYKSVIPPSKSVIKMMNKFYRRLEESLGEYLPWDVLKKMITVSRMRPWVVPTW